MGRNLARFVPDARRVAKSVSEAIYAAGAIPGGPPRVLPTVDMSHRRDACCPSLVEGATTSDAAKKSDAAKNRLPIARIRRSAERAPGARRRHASLARLLLVNGTPETSGVNMADIQLGKHRINFELHGGATGSVVTFVNGLTQSSPLWAPYTEYLVPRGYRVLSYDMLGQGRSSKPVLSVQLADQVELLPRLLDALGIDRAHVAGISFGGVVALRLAIGHPERVSSLVAMSTFSELTPQLELLGTALYEGVTQAGLPHLQNLLLPMNFSSAWLAEHRAALPELKRRGYISNDLYAIQNLVESFVDFAPFTADLGKITCPTLILNGEHDFLTPRACHETLRRNIVGSRLFIVQHAYHAFTLEFPAIVCRILGEFFRSVENASWTGDQSVWVAADDPRAAVVATPCRGDHTRAIPAGAAADDARGELAAAPEDGPHEP